MRIVISDVSLLSFSRLFTAAFVFAVMSAQPECATRVSLLAFAVTSKLFFNVVKVLSVAPGCLFFFVWLHYTSRVLPDT